jgi:hypothetical protein
MGVGVTSIRNLDRRVNIPCSLSLIPYPLSPFFFIFLRTLLHFFALGKNSSLFFSWLSALLIKKHGGRGVATLARSRFGEWGKALFSAALAKSAWCRVILPELERRPCNLGDPARIVVQSRKAGLKPNLAIQIVSLVPLLHLHNGVR